MIAETAIVKNAEIGEGTKVWAFANVYGCKIGKNCMVGAYTEIQNDVNIGDNVLIQTHAFICSLVTIEDGVFVGHGVMTINDLFPPSRKRTGTPDWKPTLIKKGAVIGSGATLLPVTVGEYSVVAAGSVVTKDVPPYTLVAGNPAKVVKNLDEKYVEEVKKMLN